MVQLKLEVSGSSSPEHKLFKTEGQVWKSDLPEYHLTTKPGVGWDILGGFSVIPHCR